MPPHPQVRPTRAEIDLDVLAHNLSVIRASAGDALVFAVVKADAYGHGLVPVARRLAREGVDGFCVALAEEGLALRSAGVSAPVIVLNGIYDGAHAEVLAAGLTPVVYDLDDVARFEEVSGDREVSVHLKVDTGMSRLGVRVGELDGFLEGLARHPRVRITGLLTHLSSAEDDADTTARQLAVFEEAYARLLARGHEPRIRHAANSGAGFLRDGARLDLVRAGVALYGVRPTLDSALDLRPVMRVVSSVARVAWIEPGDAVGYGRTWTATRRSRIATLAIGYGDGLMRHLSNRGHALVGGARCPIVGRVSMDLTTVDVTDLSSCARGDEAVLLGAQGEQTIRAEEVAEAAGTIAYEVLSNIAPRVPRVHVEVGGGRRP